MTDLSSLSQLMPTEEFSLVAPEVTITFTSFTNLDWLSGHGYNMVLVTVPVIYESAPFSLAIVAPEDVVDPIVTGREELGYPKVFQNITPVSVDRKRVTCSLAHQGVKFFQCDGQIRLNILQPGTCLAPVVSKLFNPSPRKAARKEPQRMIMLRVLPLAPRAEVISTAGSERGTDLRPRGRLIRLAMGRANITWTRPLNKMSTQSELINFLCSLTPTDQVRMAVFETHGGANTMFDNQVIARIPKSQCAGSLLAKMTSSLGCIPETPRTTRRIVVECTCDPTLLAKICPDAASSRIFITLSSFMLWGRRIQSVRFSTPVGFGDKVLVQFDDDAEMVYMSREQHGAPSMPAEIVTTQDGFTMSYSASPAITRSTSTPFRFFHCELTETGNESVKGRESRILVHNYTCTQPGNGSADGIDSGDWHIPMFEKTITLRETCDLGSSASRQACRASVHVVGSATRQESPTGFLVYQKLAALKLQPTSARMYVAEICTVLEEGSKTIPITDPVASALEMPSNPFVQGRSDLRDLLRV